jgi:hypothetical protein
MIDSIEWSKIPLMDRLLELASHSEDPLVSAALRDAYARINALEAAELAAKAEIARLQAVCTTPY